MCCGLSGMEMAGSRLRFDKADSSDCVDGAGVPGCGGVRASELRLAR